jgi:hypothetical protein
VQEWKIEDLYEGRINGEEERRGGKKGEKEGRRRNGHERDAIW